MSDSRALLRHTLATLAYRGAKAIRNPGPAFAEHDSPETSRTPGKILAHMGDLMDWALSMATVAANGTIPLRSRGKKSASVFSPP